MELNIPDFLIPEQREMIRLLKDLREKGYEWHKDSLKQVADVYQCRGKLNKYDANGNIEDTGSMIEGYCDIYNTKVEGMARAEIAAIILAAGEFGEEITLTGEKPVKIEEKTDSAVTYADIARCTSYKEVYQLLRQNHMDAKLAELMDYQDREVAAGRRLTTKKCADFVFPKRPAKPVQTVGRPEKVERANRPYAEAQELVKYFSERNVHEANYGEKMPKEIRLNFATLSLLCATAPNSVIDEAKLHC